MANEATAAANWKSSDAFVVTDRPVLDRHFAKSADVRVRLLVPHLQDERLVRLDPLGRGAAGATSDF